MVAIQMSSITTKLPSTHMLLRAAMLPWLLPDQTSQESRTTEVFHLAEIQHS